MEYQEYPAPVVDAAAANEEAKRVMTMGIVAAALSFTGIPGIILAAVGIRKSKAWAQKYGSYTAKARVGRILSIVALPSSILCLLYWLFVICFYAFLIWITLHTHDLPQPLSLEQLPEFIGMLV